MSLLPPGTPVPAFSASAGDGHIYLRMGYFRVQVREHRCTGQAEPSFSRR